MMSGSTRRAVALRGRRLDSFPLLNAETFTQEQARKPMKSLANIVSLAALWCNWARALSSHTTIRPSPAMGLRLRPPRCHPLVGSARSTPQRGRGAALPPAPDTLTAQRSRKHCVLYPRSDSRHIRAGRLVSRRSLHRCRRRLSRRVGATRRSFACSLCHYPNGKGRR